MNKTERKQKQKVPEPTIYI